MIRVQARGRRRDIGLGSTDDLTLEEARDKARELHKVARAGGDPIAARDKKNEVPPSFREAAEACHEALRAGCVASHIDYALVDTSRPLDGFLSEFFHERETTLGGGSAAPRQ